MRRLLHVQHLHLKPSRYAHARLLSVAAYFMR